MLEMGYTAELYQLARFGRLHQRRAIVQFNALVLEQAHLSAGKWAR